jgi:hypothetical protein
MNAFDLIDSIAATPAADGHIGITMRDGSYHEGYLLAYSDSYVEFGEAGPMAPEAPFHLPMDEIRSVHFMVDGRFTEHRVEPGS